MSTRERWILYPLLFLTLGTVMRDKFFAQRHFRAVDVSTSEIVAHTVHCAELEAARIKCREVAVGGPEGAEQVRMGTAPGGGGRLVLSGKAGEPAVVAGVDDDGHSGSVQTFNSEGAVEVQLASTRAGGTVTTIRRDQKVYLVLGYQGPYYGVFAQSPELARGMPLTPPWRFPPPAAPRRPLQQPPPEGVEATDEGRVKSEE